MNHQQDIFKPVDSSSRKMSQVLPLSLQAPSQALSDLHPIHPQLHNQALQTSNNKNNIMTLDLSKLQYQSMPTNHHIKTSINQANYHNVLHDHQSLNKLNEIKNEFEVLREMMIDSSILSSTHKNNDKINEKTNSLKLKMGQVIRGKQKIHNHKNKISSQSISQRQLKTERIGIHDKFYKNQQPSNYQPQKSKHQNKQSKTQKNHHKHHHHSQNMKHFQNTSRIAKKRQQIKYTSFLSNSILQKQSLELKLKSSLEKTQNLIQNQIELKSRNHLLQQTLKKYINKNSNDSQHELLQTTIKQLRTKLTTNQSQLTRYRLANKQLIQKLSKLQTQSLTTQATLSLMTQQKNQSFNTQMTMKLTIGTLEIENKKLQLQKNLDNKNSSNQIARLKQQVQFYRSHNGNYQSSSSQYQYYQDKIRTLELELQAKDRKYREMLEEMENRRQSRDEANLLELSNKLTIHRQDQQAENSITNELKRLKQQMSKLKSQRRLTQNQMSLQNKLFLFEKALKISNQQKYKHQTQMQSFHKSYQELNNKYHISQHQHQQQLAHTLQTINTLKFQLSQLHQVLQQHQQTKQQNKQLSSKICELQLQISNYQSIESQFFKLKQILRKKDLIYHLELENAKKKIDSAQFSAYKHEEQGKFNLQLSTRKLNSQLQLMNKHLKAIETDRDLHKQHFLTLQRQHHNLLLKYQDLSLDTNQQTYQHANCSSLMKQYEEQVCQLNAKFYEQEQKFIQQLMTTTKVNQEKMAIIHKNATLSNQNTELRTLCKKKTTVDASILHLWQIKLVQYQNMKLLLDYTKGTSTMTPNNATELKNNRGELSQPMGIHNYASHGYYNNANQIPRPMPGTFAPWQEVRMAASTFQH